MIAALMMSAKVAILGLLKKNVFWNKDYAVIVSVYDLTNKVLLRDSNYIEDSAMWPKFGNLSISIEKLS